MKPAAHAVILAGGRGTRFWPRSRACAPKQLLDIVGGDTMLRQTVARLAPLFPPSRLWIVTSEDQARKVCRQVPRVPRDQILAEPVGRNTAAAIGLAALHVSRRHAESTMAVLPADHYVARAARYRRILRAALDIAARGRHLVVLGIRPTRAETGFGYIERGRLYARVRGMPVYAVRRFTEKPALSRARRYVASGRYDWNAGMFFWRTAVFLEHLKLFLPGTHAALLRLGKDVGTRRYAKSLERIYPRLESVSVDYAIMEPATRKPEKAGKVLVLPAEMGWSDLGSWAAVYELLARREGEIVSESDFFALDSTGCLFAVPEKFVAAIGVRNLIVVETPDALLVCARERSQDVGKIVVGLEKQGALRLL